MPLAYPDGTVAEHRACRSSAVVFDVSHLGTVRVTGPDAFDHLQYSLSNDLRKISPGRAQYTHLLDVTRLGDRRHHRVVGRRGALRRHAQCVEHQPGGGGHRRGRCHRRAGHPGRAGPRGPCAAWPRSRRRRPRCTDSPWPASPGRAPAAWWPVPATPARTGSSAPCRREAAEELLGGRAWRPGSRRPDWVHATRCASRRACRCTATSSDRASRRSRRNWGGSWAGPRGTSSGAPRWKRRRPPARRAGCAAWWARDVSPCATAPRSRRPGRSVGRLTSGNYSPMRERGIGLALIEADAQLLDGDAVTIVQRGRSLAATLVRPPLWPPRAGGVECPTTCRTPRTNWSRCWPSSACRRSTSCSPPSPRPCGSAGAWRWPTARPNPTCWRVWSRWARPTGPVPTAWCASPAAAPTTTRSRRWCAPWPAAPSS